MKSSYNQKILIVNLSENKFVVETPDEEFYRKYLGGAAIGAYYLLRDMDPKADPFSEENIIVFSASVITGVPVSGLSRYAVVTKSPLTNTISSSEAGGFWGPELKFAGFDAVVIKGKAAKPVYIWINDGTVEIRDAAHLWGLETGDAEHQIREENADQRIRVATIGPAGENLVRFACMTTDLRHFNGRGGMGAVMGSKNLKAVAVRGKEKIPVKDSEKIREITRKMVEGWKDHGSASYLHNVGSSAFVSDQNISGQLPTKNWHTGVFDEGENISGNNIQQLPMFAGSSSCFACTIRCKKDVKAETPVKLDGRYGGPEYESLAALGSYTMIGDVYEVVKANELCNRYGLDTVSAGATVAFLMECYENGLLSEFDTGKMDLSFGSKGILCDLIHKIAYREGIGNLLAEGSKIASDHIGKGSDKYAVQCKGMELPAHDPRVKQGYALNYATHYSGANHMTLIGDTAADLGTSESGMKILRLLGIDKRVGLSILDNDKTRFVYYGQIAASVLDCLSVCMYCFTPHFYTFNELVEIINAITGWDTSLWELMKVGERTIEMCRLFNISAGMKNSDDRLPERMFEPIESGPYKGFKVDKDDFKNSVDLLHKMFGWDPITGLPDHGRLLELDIESLSPRAASKGKNQ